MTELIKFMMYKSLYIANIKKLNQYNVTILSKHLVKS